jgi:hypothetical protein
MSLITKELLLKARDPKEPRVYHTIKNISIEILRTVYYGADVYWVPIEQRRDDSDRHKLIAEYFQSLGFGVEWPENYDKYAKYPVRMNIYWNKGHVENIEAKDQRKALCQLAKKWDKLVKEIE